MSEADNKLLHQWINFQSVSGISKEDIQKRENLVDTITSYDGLILPFKLTWEEKQLETHLTNIVRSVHTTQPLDPAAITRFDVDQLLVVLNLEAPKRVIQYVGPVTVAAAKPKGPTRKRVRKPAGQGKLVRLGNNAPTEVASIYTERPPQGSGGDSQLFKRKKKDDDGDDYGDGGDGDGDEDDEEVKRGDTIGSRLAKLQMPQSVDDDQFSGQSGARAVCLPSNFYEIIRGVFFTFWELEFDETEVTWAFFAKITSANCSEFRLTAFAERSYCLAVIKDKIDNKQYVSVEDFEYDFHQMFSNIFEFFAADHAAHKKAQELSMVFESKWAKSKPMLDNRT